MIYLLALLTGGRPMTLITYCDFVDKVSGKPVGLYRDYFGRTYLAEHPWARFRVGINPTVDD